MCLDTDYHNVQEHLCKYILIINSVLIIYVVYCACAKRSAERKIIKSVGAN